MYSRGAENNYVQLTIVKYDSNGHQVWVASDNQPAVGILNVQGFAMDGGGNLYVEANLGPLPPAAYSTYKYTSNGSLAWSASDPMANYYNYAAGLALDSGTNVLITGRTEYKYTVSLQTGYVYYYVYGTYKLNAAGNYLWTNDYPSPSVGSSVANAITIDSANNVYVTGYSTATSSNNDIVTIKYNSNGNQAWLQRYTSPGGGNAVGNSIAVDNSGNVYVTGYDTLPGGGTEIVTIKYSAVTLQILPNGTVQLQAQGSPGESFDVKASADLLNWQDLGSGFADTNGLFQFDDTNAPLFNARFYTTVPQ
jgi:hypothetical protein